ncbi:MULTISPECIES: DUF4136 domain-containing protein [Microbulbifer]|uniref:DUF4136 domain-containing protein n=1 Tax=Microbulbifer celer TaxID=435905 RepID=A0ABW3U8V3_9GAMM|nr:MULTISPECIES: DUF4136 domain-containing protein [Microbulbifer]UFN58473.1 DUF4136 domain-containing protein [Microbulbifer celer]
MRVWKTASAIAAVLLAGCAGSPTNSTDPLAASWSQYQTFGFAEGRPPSRGQTIAQQEVAQQLMARGLTFSNTPDVLVDVNVFATPGPQVRDRRGIHADVKSSTAGHLTIDLMDAKQKSTLWRGQALQPVTRQGLNNPQRALDRAVNDAFRSFPVKAR